MPQRWVADQELFVAQESGDQRPEQGTLPSNISRSGRVGQTALFRRHYKRGSGSTSGDFDFQRQEL
jgi:hypothetical protein